jgi:ribonuclease III
LDQIVEFLQGVHYQPSDSALLQQALTHRSFSTDNNERLEFVGDAVIDLIIAELLYTQFADKQEGELSRYRAELVRSATLAEIAREIGLHHVVRLGDGERKSGGADRESILSGTLEALFAAIYFDAGMDYCQVLAKRIFASRLQNIQNAADKKDPKTALQEMLQSTNKSLPQYELLKTEGKDHHQTFYITCYVAAFKKSVEAAGSSKKIAEKNAAQLMLDWIAKEKKL